MEWTVPGTTITAPREDICRVQDRLCYLFLAGGLSLSQVANITGLDPYMIQNWVKRGFLSKPEQKRYSLNQLCRIIIINMLRGVFPMERICSLLRYINGRLDDESDDIIDDAMLYFVFLRLAVQPLGEDPRQQWEQAIRESTAGFPEPFPGARDRLCHALLIMLTAWEAARTAQEAEKMMAALEIPEKEA